jgi:hypothetical protein
MATAQGVNIYFINSDDDDIRSMGSEGSSLGTVADDNDEPDDVTLSLEQHVAIHLANIAGAIENLDIRSLSDGPGETHRRLVLAPSASKSSSLHMHPSLYRNVSPINNNDEWRICLVFAIIGPPMTDMFLHLVQYALFSLITSAAVSDLIQFDNQCSSL